MDEPQRITLLGTVDIEANGRPSPLLKHRKGIALLVYLIVKGEPQPRDAIADLLWETTSTGQGLRNLRRLLHSIRSLLPELVVTRQQLSLMLPSTTEVDYLQLKTALVDEDIDRQRAGLALYAGDLLESIHLDGTPRFEAWLRAEQVALHEQVVAACRRVWAASIEREAWPEAVDVARRWLELAPYDEAAARALMRALALNDRLADALQAYQTWREALLDQLGVEPEPETAAVAAELAARQRPRPDRLAAVGMLPPGSMLPYPRNMTFVGRVDALLQLADQLLPPTDGTPARVPAVVISGLGGLGKSQLAVEYAYRYGRFYAGGVFWISFATAADVPEAVAAIGDESGMGVFHSAERLSLDARVAQVRRAWQATTPRLLIFDNCDDIQLAATWLPRSGGCRVLITSRATRWPPELPIVERPLAPLSRPAGVDLLRQFAPRLKPAVATAIAEVLGDLPLALQLAGHYLRLHEDVQPARYLAELRAKPAVSHASLQGEVAPYSPTGHRLHVARTFAVSLAQLDARDPADAVARQLLSRAACLAPQQPISRRFLAETVVDNHAPPADRARARLALNRLLALGCLAATEEDAILIHPLMAQYVLEQQEDGSADAMAAVEDALRRSLWQAREAQGNLLALPVAAAHVRYVTDRALRRGDGAAVYLAILYGEHLVAAADYAAARRYLEPALERAVMAFGDDSLAVAAASAGLGTLHRLLGAYAQALPYVERALAIHKARFGLDHRETGRMLNEMGNIRLRLGPYASAAPYFEQALAVREKVLGPEHAETLSTLNNLGALHNFMGEYAVARTYFERVLEVRERVLGPNHLQTAVSLSNLGDLLSRRGEPDVGRPYLERAAAIRRRELGEDHPLTIACRTNLGHCLNAGGDHAAAEALLTETLATVRRKLGDAHPLTARVWNSLGLAHIGLGQYEAAREALEQARAIRTEVKGAAHPDTAYSIYCLGELETAMGHPDAARAYYDQARAIWEQTVEPTHGGLEKVKRGK